VSEMNSTIPALEDNYTFTGISSLRCPETPSDPGQ